MQFMRFFRSAFFAVALLVVPTLSQANSSAKATDYLVTDFGLFIGDNTNFNGIFRVQVTGEVVKAQVTTTKMDESGAGGSSSDPFAVNVPDEVVAEMILKPTSNGLYTIENLVVKNKQYGKSLVFKNGGVVDFQAPADFGVEMRYRDSANDPAYLNIPYIKIDRP